MRFFIRLFLILGLLHSAVSESNFRRFNRFNGSKRPFLTLIKKCGLPAVKLGFSCIGGGLQFYGSWIYYQQYMKNPESDSANASWYRAMSLIMTGLATIAVGGGKSSYRILGHFYQAGRKRASYKSHIKLVKSSPGRKTYRYVSNVPEKKNWLRKSLDWFFNDNK